MKKTLILSTLILMAVMIGCSNNTGLTGPENQTSNSGKTPPSVDMTLIWQYAELSVNSNDLTNLENWASCTTLDQSLPTSYMITFNGITNADKWSNGYSGLVELTKDNEVVLTLNDKISINKHTEFRLTNVRANNLSFHIAIFQIDGKGLNKTKTIDESCFLNLTDLRIYTINQ
jgi:hypothetical protein